MKFFKEENSKPENQDFQAPTTGINDLETTSEEIDLVAWKKIRELSNNLEILDFYIKESEDINKIRDLEVKKQLICEELINYYGLQIDQGLQSSDQKYLIESLKVLINLSPPKLYDRLHPAGTEDAIFNFITDRVKNHLKKLEDYKFVIDADPTLASYSLELINFLATWGKTQDDRQKAVDVLSNHFDTIVDSVTNFGSWNMGQRHRIDNSFAILLTFGSPDQQEKAINIAQELITGKDIKSYFGREIALSLYYNPHEVAQRKGEKLFDTMLKNHGFDNSQDLLGWWQDDDRFPQKAIESNCDAIERIDEKRPSTAAQLYNEFGIRDFRRYHDRILIQQIEHKDDKGKQYGVIIMPRSDWNGAFASKVHMFDKLFKDLEVLGYIARIIEVADKGEALRRLLQMRDSYGASSFMIIGGHGTSDSISFGDNRPLGIMRQKEFERLKAQQLRQFLNPGSTVILSSCSTGAREGIGQSLSRAIDAKVIAPNKPTSIRDINPRIDNGKILFEVNYSDTDAIQQYESGQFAG